MRFSILAIIGAAGLVQAYVPSDLAAGFDERYQMQASYDKDVASGYMDGQQYSQDKTMYQPNYGLRDYSHSTRSSDKFVILVIDTTDEHHRRMHYMHHDYQYSQDSYVMASQSTPDMGYWAPGYLGEQGQGRTYCHLLYKQPDNFQVSNMPQLGDEIDVHSFEHSCGLDRAVAGLSYNVDIQSSHDDYKQYRSQMENMGGYGSYWNYMPKYNQYNLGYNKQTQYGNQYQKGWNQYQYMGSDKGQYTSTTETYVAPTTYSMTYQTEYMQTSPAGGYPMATPTTEPAAATTSTSTETSTSTSTSTYQIATPETSPLEAPTPSTAAATFTSQTVASPAAATGGANQPSASPSPLRGAANSMHERASSAVAIGLCMAGLAAMML